MAVRDEIKIQKARESDEQRLSILMRSMLGINLLIYLLLTVILVRTTDLICRSGGARTFLLQVGTLPESASLRAARTLALFAALCALIAAKNRFPARHTLSRALLAAGEIVLGVLLVASTDFSYNGILLVILGDLGHYVRRNTVRIPLAALIAVLYVALRSNVLGARLSLVTISSYLTYYSGTVRSLLSSLQEALGALNLLIFVLYLLLLFDREVEERLRVAKLNEQLRETNDRLAVSNARLGAANHKLSQANEQLQAYSQEIERLTATRERNRLAREIHDTLGHTLTGIIMLAQATLVIFDLQPQAARQQLQVIGDTAREGLDDVRRSIKALRPDALERQSLDDALSGLVERFAQMTGATVHYHQKAGELNVSEDESDAIYRIIQESLTNAVRHGGAQNISVLLHREGQQLTILVMDDGTGMEGETEPGFGLHHMRERIGMLGGRLRYGNRQDGKQGFYVHARILLRQDGKEKEEGKNREESKQLRPTAEPLQAGREYEANDQDCDCRRS